MILSKWSHKVALPMGPGWGDPENGAGGVAACMVWNRSKPPFGPPQAPPESHRTVRYRPSSRHDHRKPPAGRYSPQEYHDCGTMTYPSHNVQIFRRPHEDLDYYDDIYTKRNAVTQTQPRYTSRRPVTPKRPSWRPGGKHVVTVPTPKPPVERWAESRVKEYWEPELVDMITSPEMVTPHAPPARPRSVSGHYARSKTHRHRPSTPQYQRDDATIRYSTEIHKEFIDEHVRGIRAASYASPTKAVGFTSRNSRPFNPTPPPPKPPAYPHSYRPNNQVSAQDIHTANHFSTYSSANVNKYPNFYNGFVDNTKNTNVEAAKNSKNLAHVNTHRKNTDVPGDITVKVDCPENPLTCITVRVNTARGEKSKTYTIDKAMNRY